MNIEINSQIVLSVCIATFKRSELLKKLLKSIEQQELHDNIRLEIIVVDNDKNGSARNIVQGFSDSQNINYFYFIQPEKNISLTRNLGVKNASGEYILFIDDDEYADNKWIMNLLNTLISFNADGVFGKVTSYFLPEVPYWIKSCFIYNRPSFETGSPATFTRSGNCLVKSSLLHSVDGPFDPLYGITGGSDTMLFGSLIKNGAKFVNCNEAETFEFVPRQRATLQWLTKRAFRTGNGFARRLIQLKKKNKFLFKIRFILIGISYSILSLSLILILFPSKSKRIHWFLKLIANSGKFAAVFGYFPSEYS
ncbi:MAG: glycosyltransferase family 2 protein [Calditrichae bacterium]|nr:glycosyltransferase family 2 protein [Calditrichia bacterium]